MSIAFYHVLHIYAVIGLVASLTHLCLNETYSKKATMIFGLSTLILFVAGMGMTHKYGLDFSNGWLLGKLIIWLAVGFGVPVIVKRMPHLKQKLYSVAMVLMLIAIYLVNMKPG